MKHPPLLQPWDEHNRRLQAHVHPSDWKSPTPAPRYNLVVIGGGTAGLVTAAGAAGLGAKVALIERHLLGGDCLNVGCVPSKALIRAARAAAEARASARFGVKITGEVAVDFSAVMERMRRLRADLSPHDSAARFRELGVDVFIGEARFASGDTVQVGGQALRFAKAVIATGARASAPPITGLAEVPYLTNETLFSLTELPRRLAIVGAGPIGCEMAQAFARFGAEVTLIESAAGILPREDREAAEILRAALERDGVRILCDGRDLKVARAPDDGVIWQLASAGQQQAGHADRLLVAVGRAPNVEGLGLEAAGIAFGRQGVKVDDFLRTTNRRVYACGDVCSRFQFTHAADFMARIVIQNALFKGRRRVSALTIPWSTYTSPEVAQIGLGPADAKVRGLAMDTFTQPLAKVDRAILDDEADGFVRVHVRRGTDQIVGATVVAAHAGDTIGELSLAMTNKIGLGRVGAAIHPYPTQAEAIRRVGDLYSRTRLTPWVKRVFSWWLAWQRAEFGQRRSPQARPHPLMAP
ncbi:mercuric reductase [Opitutus terrae]|uniref:Pyridine nucleotide-disulphide oxidoreductase dimerisation region n=1 Tax=Opitutus terrae (strain DSM 11246 / JCM 15787 / PB90-1) TaxID=452637 RepID=B1ZQB9_OPITP|nr:mercuric reductase [Opitutus terrae]ACB73599.1 pyridine nucleotide-disulphide oxidoreductase dimerisation region [Opitutus terrae PB90-1]